MNFHCEKSCIILHLIFQYLMICLMNEILNIHVSFQRISFIQVYILAYKYNPWVLQNYPQSKGSTNEFFNQFKIHSLIRTGLEKGIQIKCGWCETQSYRKKHDWLSGRKNTETKDSFSGTLDIDQISQIVYPKSLNDPTPPRL